MGDQQESNASLIAELLVALKLLRIDHSVMEPHHEDICSICAQADAAIAKAEATNG